MSDEPIRKHTEVIREALALEGARVLDAGCGDGALVRFMTRQGARVTGLECGAKQLARARAAERAGEERYVGGIGQALPFAAAAFDIVVYFNALHHVPVAEQAAALDEAARVLVSGGRLYVQEPLARGAYFEAMRRIEDETAVRAAAYEALGAAAADGRWRPLQETVYAAPIKYASFAAWRENFLAIDPARQKMLDGKEAELEAAFEATADRSAGDFRFNQPARLNLMKRLEPRGGP